MNFFQLECFVEAVEKGSFAEVAAAMHVTQPTITYQINNLESELEEKLFVRTRKGVAATRAGQLFCEDARVILSQYYQALNRFRHAASPAESVIRVGFTRFPDNYELSVDLWTLPLEDEQCEEECVFSIWNPQNKLLVSDTLSLTDIVDKLISIYKQTKEEMTAGE